MRVLEPIGRPCSLCSAPAEGHVNEVPYCRACLRQGFVIEARELARRQGGERDEIEAAAEWANEIYDEEIEAVLGEDDRWN